MDAAIPLHAASRHRSSGVHLREQPISTAYGREIEIGWPTPARLMVAGIRSYLAAAGLDVAHEQAKGALVLSSEQSHLTNGRFDVNKMLGTLVDVLNRTLKDGYEGLWATGDMTWEFGSEKNFDKLLEYERGLEEIFRQHPALCGICQYHQDTLPIDTIEKSLRTHQAVYINATLSLINPFYDSPDSTTDSHGPDSSVQLEAMLKHLGRPLDS